VERLGFVGFLLRLVIGVSGAHLRRRLTGQADVDEVDSR
jgi:hypothetical protein